MITDLIRRLLAKTSDTCQTIYVFNHLNKQFKSVVFPVEMPDNTYTHKLIHPMILTLSKPQGISLNTMVIKNCHQNVPRKY